MASLLRGGVLAALKRELEAEAPDGPGAPRMIHQAVVQLRDIRLAANTSSVNDGKVIFEACFGEDCLSQVLNDETSLGDINGGIVSLERFVFRPNYNFSFLIVEIEKLRFIGAAQMDLSKEPESSKRVAEVARYLARERSASKPDNGVAFDRSALSQIADEIAAEGNEGGLILDVEITDIACLIPSDIEKKLADLPGWKMDETAGAHMAAAAAAAAAAANGGLASDIDTQPPYESQVYHHHENLQITDSYREQSSITMLTLQPTVAEEEEEEKEEELEEEKEKPQEEEEAEKEKEKEKEKEVIEVEDEETQRASQLLENEENAAEKKKKKNKDDEEAEEKEDGIEDLVIPESDSEDELDSQILPQQNRPKRDTTKKATKEKNKKKSKRQQKSSQSSSQESEKKVVEEEEDVAAAVAAAGKAGEEDQQLEDDSDGIRLDMLCTQPSFESQMDDTIGSFVSQDASSQSLQTQPPSTQAPAPASSLPIVIEEEQQPQEEEEVEQEKVEERRIEKENNNNNKNNNKRKQRASLLERAAPGLKRPNYARWISVISAALQTSG